MAFLLLYWKWIAAAAVIAALTIAYNVHVNRLIDKAVVKAVTERDAEWRASEEEAIQAAKERARAEEAGHKTALDAIAAQHEKEMNDANKKLAALNASVRAGARLRIASGCTSSGNASDAASPAGVGDGKAGAQFLGEADSAFLIGEAARADAIVRQLTQCQAVVIEDRKVTP